MALKSKGRTTAAGMAAVLLCGGMGMRAQTNSTVKDDLFAGTEKFAQNASSVTEVDMDPDSLDMVSGHNSSRARRTVLSVVHTYTYDKPGMYNMADVDAFRNKLNTGDWHCSVHVRELKSGESTDVCRKHRTDDLEEQAIITVEPKELTFIHTIRKPASSSGPSGTSGKPGGSESFFVPPFGGDFPYSMDMPLSARSAEMHANAAEMRAEGAIMRAEMAAMRPEMLGDMAAMRANLAGNIPGFTMDLFPNGSSASVDGQPLINQDWINGLTRSLSGLPQELNGRPLILRRDGSAQTLAPKHDHPDDNSVAPDSKTAPKP